MSGGRSLRVLMLGWEYPPRYVGGLGKASQGIACGLAACGIEVLFVLPGFGLSQHAANLQVTGVHEWLQRHTGAPGDNATRATGHPEWVRSSARLLPYRSIRSVELQPSDREGHDEAIYGSQLGCEVERFAGEVGRMAAHACADLVHAHDWMTFPAAIAAADRHCIPLFLHVHSTEYDRSGNGANEAIAAIERHAFDCATHIFAVSDYTRSILIERYAVPAPKISVVYNAPDEAAIATIPLPLAAPGVRRPWVVFLGRLTFQKGPDHFLRAAAIVARHNAEARFLMCGSGDMLETLRALAHELGMADRVEFRGFLDPPAVDKLLGQSSLLVMSSVSEPFGLVALEALRAGTPVIVSRQSGVREVLGHSLQVDFWDHDKLADQMLAVLRLPPLGMQLVEEGRRQLEQLSWEDSAQRIIESYADGGAVAGAAGA
ncbi:glycosyltransferase family 4 protein [Dyella jejuensis]|uniref:Glycosyltransferase family 4 protein n=1 Tax=Dyella jejuensis TaxID=1432009 RepID=A0ABW8JMA2_9GAMM